ncbi:hypothetical protein TREMEDRAFT_31124, partial [Tremella mesenterica DSM 1558]|uniref:uncharacterized protein n=1 Tax=Tremella mesenterica (strain ATCC 24925 / CBS 8224 / DSM 1558 / NBRC 9311 / NRRL Y-6157 / RJB 2259-6 / UBC 559-6) TaxID=578456 RepID=UPI0003F4A546
SLSSFDTVYSADSVEFCPQVGYQDILVCGTYQVLEQMNGEVMQNDQREVDGDESYQNEMEKRQTERIGRVYLFRVVDERLVEIQRIETSAVLDMKWAPRTSDEPLLAISDAKGCITFYSLLPSYQLVLKDRIQVCEKTTLCLSLDWAPRGLYEGNLIVSLSSGKLVLLSPSTFGLNGSNWEMNIWNGHDYEPWIVIFDQHDPHTVWSGGDDLFLKKWDLRDTSHPTFISKRFPAGITTLSSSPHNRYLAVGSYDGIIRIYQTHPHSPPTFLAELDVGGGIWRARWFPFPQRKDLILLACMHDGFKVVEFQDSKDLRNGDVEEDSGTGDYGLKIVRRFDQHSSLAYGVDWCRLSPTIEGDNLVASCSFYDHMLHLWKG